MFQGILTVAIYVTDMARAKKFYTETLGFEQGWDVHENLSFFKVGGTYVYLEAGYEPAGIAERSVRLSFFLETEKSVKEVFDTLKARGVNTVQDAPQQVGDEVWWFQFRDPDGNILEVSGKP